MKCVLVGHIFVTSDSSVSLLDRELDNPNLKKGKILKLRINWNASKGNQAPIQKFEKPNQKIPKSKIFLTSVKNWCPQLT